jgi:hypothetical protein
MTRSVREIFYKVEKHLLKQNERAESGGNCQYRTDSGLSCAVGCLMTDDIYDSSFEGVNMQDRRVRKALTPIVGVDYELRLRKLGLLDQLQEVHDDSPVEHWASNLAQIKLEFDIS